MSSRTIRTGLRFTLLFVLALAGLRLMAQNAATSVSVDADANQHPINPNIYGICAAGTSDILALNAPLNRLGGDLTSTYNWQIDALNLSHDWYWESYTQSSPIVPGKSIDVSIQNTFAAKVGSEPMVTIPMLPYIATVGANATPNAASLWSFSVKKYGAQTSDGSGLEANDPYQADAGSGVSAAGKDIVNNPLDAYVPNSLAIQQAWLKHLIATWGNSTAATGVKYYVLDNEPSIWNGTHRDVHPDPETYEEIYKDIVANATAIRAADPNAKIIAPEEWTWWAMYESGLDQKNGTGAGSDYATHGDTYYYPWLLQQLAAYEKAHGVKLIDALTVHCYNQTPDGGDDSAAGQAIRNQETRILWDPNFVDLSWMGTLGINGGVLDWIPTMKKWVNQYYPGLEVGCTEYNWGDEPALNGATAQADVEGIYGAYGLDLATRWTAPANPSPTYLAMQIYRNYDGKLSTFGDTSVAATVFNPDTLSSFAAVRSSDGALTAVVINKKQGATPVTLSLGNFPTKGTAQAYQISSATQKAIASLGSVTVENNEITATVPSQSITLFVIPAGTELAKPIAPTGLAATTASGTATLTWLATGGATSYTIGRGTKSGGPFTTVGTVQSPALTSFTDTGLTNGTTYYYVVSGTNKAGTGPDSAPLAVTAQIPPVFAATAAPAPATIAASGTSTVTFSVKNTGGPIANAIVEVQVTGPGGAAAGSQIYSGQNFAAGGTLTFTYKWTPSSLSPPATLDGNYAVAVGVFDSTWKTDYYWNGSAATIALTGGTAPPAFAATAAAKPTVITAKGSSTVTFTVKDTGGALSNANVEVQMFNSASVASGYQVFSGQNFTAGGSLAFTFTWKPSAESPAVTGDGTYSVAIGVFDSTWSTDYYWNGDAAKIAIESAPPAPAGLKAAAGDESVALSWNASSGAASYNVYRGMKTGGEGGVPIATGLTKTAYSDAKLANGTKYYYRVAAVNGVGAGALSAEVSATPGLAAAVALSSSASAAVAWGSAVTFKAKVAGSGTAVPAGVVEFFAGTALLGSANLSGGVATLTTSALAVGTNEVTAMYEGYGVYRAAESARLAQVVAKAAPGATLTWTPELPSNSTLIATLTLTGVKGQAAPNGLVEFFDNGKLAATVALKAGAAEWKASGLTQGKHTLEAEYEGDGDYGTVEKTVSVAVNLVALFEGAGRRASKP